MLFLMLVHSRNLLLISRIPLVAHLAADLVSSEVKARLTTNIQLYNNTVNIIEKRNNIIIGLPEAAVSAQEVPRIDFWVVLCFCPISSSLVPVHILLFATCVLITIKFYASICTFCSCIRLFDAIGLVLLLPMILFVTFCLAGVGFLLCLWDRILGVCKIIIWALCFSLSAVCSSLKGLIQRDFIFLYRCLFGCFLLKVLLNLFSMSCN